MLDILTFDEAEWGQTDVITEVMKRGNDYVSHIQLIHQFLLLAAQIHLLQIFCSAHY